MNHHNHPRRIAVLHAMPYRGDVYFDETLPNHYRYTLFERNVRIKDDPAGKRQFKIVSKIVLRYEDTSIWEFLAQTRHSFSVSRGLRAVHNDVFGMEGPDAAIAVAMTISGSDRLTAKYLGEIDGYHCYVAYKESYLAAREVPYHFSLRSVPTHGMANVVYAPDTARNSFKRPNITETHVKSDDDFDELALFNKMDALIAPIMAPMVALLPPVKENK